MIDLADADDAAGFAPANSGNRVGHDPADFAQILRSDPLETHNLPRRLHLLCARCVRTGSFTRAWPLN
jgi:hypothetical protein